MFNIEEFLRSKGKVKAPDDFTSGVIQKVDKIMKTKEFIDYLFSIWIKLVIFIYKSIDNFFTAKKKIDV